MDRPSKYCAACQNCFYEISTIFFTLWEIWLPYDFVRSHWVVSSWHFDLKNCKEVKKSSRFKVIGPRQLCTMRLYVFWTWIIITIHASFITCSGILTVLKDRKTSCKNGVLNRYMYKLCGILFIACMVYNTVLEPKS